MLSQRPAFVRRLAQLIKPCVPPVRRLQSQSLIQSRPSFPSKYTSTLPSPEAALAQDLEESKLDKWGWLIYRTTYKDDNLWLRFRHALDTQLRTEIACSDTPEIAQSLDLTFVEDINTLNGASVPKLRERFNAWAATAAIRENPRAEHWLSPHSSRYQYFVNIDEESLLSFQSHLSHLSAKALLSRGYVNLVDAQWKPVYGDEEWMALRDEEDYYDPIDGCTEENVGWMHIRASSLGFESYNSLDSGSWYVYYKRTPYFAEL